MTHCRVVLGAGKRLSGQWGFSCFAFPKIAACAARMDVMRAGRMNRNSKCTWSTAWGRGQPLRWEFSQGSAQPATSFTFHSVISQSVYRNAGLFTLPAHYCRTVVWLADASQPMSVIAFKASSKSERSQKVIEFVCIIKGHHWLWPMTNWDVTWCRIITAPPLDAPPPFFLTSSRLFFFS